MSLSLLRCLNRGGGGYLNVTNNATKLSLPASSSVPIVGVTNIVHYSRRSDPKNLDSVFKVVKSKARVEEATDFLGGECGPNWELLAPRGNRFYFPNAVGPAWQGASTTITLEAPLESIVDFDGKNTKQNAMLEFTVGECPSLIRKSLHELFPAPEVVSSEKLALMTLRFSGDNEQGARKFVLAAREITSRLRLHGYWADFMNPFSGKPFYSWANGKNLYKVDDRFRGINMKLIKKNHCTVISTEDGDVTFSGVIYTNAPCDYLQIKSLIDEQV
ncbi:methylmalonic aciduria and homocystinuria type D homolog, mitochondrial [Ceratitis capitata]|uniref:Methylmalonic aciduria and homocystinuria type D, mitochondrial n=1 Tax=Ceratitis capitata TaxID=7213 RepID=W8CCZ2_CERCA|nr:methylmalonic aciduria and homocystinuria type D homolog, mitochondrial [Ceratitis capitata]